MSWSASPNPWTDLARRHLGHFRRHFTKQPKGRPALQNRSFCGRFWRLLLSREFLSAPSRERSAMTIELGRAGVAKTFDPEYRQTLH
jgi:hypothetical protein